MNPLLELKKSGQSLWYDGLRRGLITSGELKRMVDEYGLTGVKSSPPAMELAISGTDEYDGEISEYKREGAGEEEIIKRLAASDARGAADVLTPVYRESDGKDGFATVWLPLLSAGKAKDTAGEALRLISLIDRPNIMIEAPGTPEGLPLIEELVYEGCNICVTPLFSVKGYEDVARAYVRGLERRRSEGRPVDGVTGVAGFSVSGGDTIVDRIIEERAAMASSHDERARLKELTGRAALANARLAYAKQMEIFEGDGFSALRGEGAGALRLLWTDTSAKDPLYSDVKYIEGLIGPCTVSAMDLRTLLAFHDHGSPSAALIEGVEAAKRVFSELSELKIDCDRLSRVIEDAAIKGLADSRGSLVERIKEKKKAASSARRPMSVEYSIRGFEPAIEAAVGELGRDNFLSRLWAKDPTLWKHDPEAKGIIRNALGWLTVPGVMEGRKVGITDFAAEVRREGFKSVVLLGMGGSSLAPLVLARSFGPRPGYPELIVLDSTDPEAVKSVEAAVDLKKTLFIVSSKSGSTIEPLSFFEYYYARLHKEIGEGAGGNFAAITDPNSALEGFSKKYRMRKLFTNPADIGGRFSALSYFGLVPAALAGIDISKLLYHGLRVQSSVHPCVTEARSPAIRLGAALAELAKAGRDKVTFLLPDGISAFGLWLEQLIAESTGKEGKGLVPIAGEPPAHPGGYGNDRVFVHIGLGPANRKTASSLKALSSAGHPVISYRLNDIHEIGGEFLKWEVATSVAGRILGINPFDQPDVELAKKLALARLGSKGKEPGKKGAPVELDGKKLALFFGRATFDMLEERGLKDRDVKKAMKGYMGLLKEGDYIGVMAYFNTFDPEIDGAFTEARKVLRDSTKAAVQFGYGPRYLHSTGQLHKGGAKKGLFIILCHEPGADLEIPGSRFSFSGLELSQAFGDMEALDEKGCRVALVKLRDPGIESVKEAIRLIKGAVK
ncbi:MAG: bifunctional transaldolase/phosoglucose isomerase [Deltaproteobacteria bacterium]|nr:bifunctional transaldolase/phosoglucose isomerase [Deltaproteobacteria bacterium]